MQKHNVKFVINMTKESTEVLGNFFKEGVAFCSLSVKLREEMLKRNEMFQNALELAEDAADVMDMANFAIVDSIVDYAYQLDAYAIIADHTEGAVGFVKNVMKKKLDLRVFLFDDGKLLCEGDIRNLSFDEFYMKKDEFFDLAAAKEYLANSLKKFRGANDDFDMVAEDVLAIKDNLTDVTQVNYFIKVLAECLEGKAPEYYHSGVHGIFKQGDKQKIFSAISTLFDALIGIEQQYEIVFVGEHERETLKQLVHQNNAEAIVNMMLETGCTLVVTENEKLAKTLAETCGAENVFIYKPNGLVVSVEGKNLSHTSLIMGLLLDDK